MHRLTAKIKFSKYKRAVFGQTLINARQYLFPDTRYTV